ncbi:hypothetical protein [Ligilactobacillus agilis]|uniref:hypothetical protein n=1 Tax=Ligilactobacillus agilis TaxID=1601 RepID=UPI00255C8592|nr:hypothetical protein [Ligilactobacillus agilis]
MNDYLARGKSKVLLPLIWDELEIVPTKVRSAIRLINTGKVTQGVWLLTEGENNYRYQAVIDGETVALNFNNFVLESSECGFEYDNEYEKKPCKHILAASCRNLSRVWCIHICIFIVKILWPKYFSHKAACS